MPRQVDLAARVNSDTYAPNMARIALTGLLFISSRDGISQNPAEWTDSDYIRDGARVLVAALVRLAAA